MKKKEIQENGDSEEKIDGGEFVEDSTPEPEGTVEEQEATAPEQEEKLFDQESANKAFIRNKQKLREEAKAKEAAEAKAAELAKELAKYKETGRPEIPESPDPFDDGFEEKTKERDEAIKAAAIYDREKEAKKEAERHKIEAVKTQQLEKDRKLLEKYGARVKELGLDPDEQAKKENILDAYVSDPDLARYLIGHEDGPLAVSFLVENHMEMEKIGGMGSMEAAVYIATNVIPNAQKLKPEITKTPDPLFIPSGKGAPVTSENDKYMQGGQFVE